MSGSIREELVEIMSALTDEQVAVLVSVARMMRSSGEVSIGERVDTVLHQRQHRYTLEELLQGITDENRHPEFDWGKPVGKEIW